MSDPFNSVHLTVTAADLNADGAVESLVTDHDGDLVADGVLTDLDGDGVADVGVLDTNADGYVDVLGIDTGRDGMADVAIVDSDYDGSADTVLTTGQGVALVQAVPVPAECPPAGSGDDIYTFAGSGEETANSSGALYGVPSQTQAVIDTVDNGMKNANTIYRDALDPGSVSAEEVAAASERAIGRADDVL